MPKIKKTQNKLEPEIKDLELETEDDSKDLELEVLETEDDSKDLELEAGDTFRFMLRGNIQHDGVLFPKGKKLRDINIFPEEVGKKFIEQKTIVKIERS